MLVVYHVKNLYSLCVMLSSLASRMNVGLCRVEVVNSPSIRCPRLRFVRRVPFFVVFIFCFSFLVCYLVGRAVAPMDFHFPYMMLSCLQSDFVLLFISVHVHCFCVCCFFHLLLSCNILCWALLIVATVTLVCISFSIALRIGI